MMNRILYSTGCAVFAPIPLADTRPCHLIVAKKRETLKHALLVMIFTLDNVIQCDTMWYNVIQCVCFVAMFWVSRIHVTYNLIITILWDGQKRPRLRSESSTPSNMVKSFGKAFWVFNNNGRKMWTVLYSSVVVKTFGKMERKMTNLSVNPFTIGAIPSHHWRPLRYAWGLTSPDTLETEPF